MRKSYIIMAAITVLASLSSPALAQKKVGRTGFQFLKIGVGARAAAMGEAQVAVVRDATAMFWNPAGLSQISGHDFFLTHIEWLVDTSIDALGYAINLGQYGSVGINLLMVNYGEFQETRFDETIPEGYVITGNTFIAKDWTAGISYAKQLTDKFSVGGTIKYLREELAEKKAEKLIIDFGTLYFTGYKTIRFGASIRNFGSDTKYFQEEFMVPMVLALGIAADPLGQPGDTHFLTVAVDALHPNDYTERMNFGAEYWFANRLALRLGYKLNSDEEDLTAGLGIRWNFGSLRARVDYAYAKFGNEAFETPQRFSLGISF